jgi:hypothetical protein
MDDGPDQTESHQVPSSATGTEGAASLNPTGDSNRLKELIISFTQTPAQFGIDRARGESWLNQFSRLCVESGVDQSLKHIVSWRDQVLVTIHATLMTYQSSEDLRGSAQANKAQVESRFPLAEALGIACRTHAFYLSVVERYRIMRPRKSKEKIKLSLFCLRMVYAQIACLAPKSLHEKRDLGAIKVEDNAFINEIYSFFGEEREYTDKPRPSESTGDKRKEWELVLATMLGTKLEGTGYRERISHLQQALVSSELPITSNDDVRWQRFCQALDLVG